MKKVLITGAAGDLGKALIKVLLKDEALEIIATARGKSLEDLSILYSQTPRVRVIELDLLKPETFKKAIEPLGGVDILINNAAISYRAVMEHVNDIDEKNQMQTNYFSARELIRLCLPYMKRHRRGKIINISSVGGMMAMPTMSSYSASKFALEGMSEALWYEVRPFCVSVTLVQIGFVNSNGFKKVVRPLIADYEEEYNNYYESMEEFVKMLMTNSWATSDSIAKKIYKEVIKKHRPPLRISATADAVFFGILRRFIPRSLYHLILYWSLPMSWRKSIKRIKKLWS